MPSVTPRMSAVTLVNHRDTILLFHMNCAYVCLCICQRRGCYCTMRDACLISVLPSEVLGPIASTWVYGEKVSVSCSASAGSESGRWSTLFSWRPVTSVRQTAHSISSEER